MPTTTPAAAVNSSKEYRDIAARLRREAETATDAGIKERLLDQARRFDQLAETVEMTARRLAGE